MRRRQQPDNPNQPMHSQVKSADHQSAQLKEFIRRYMMLPADVRQEAFDILRASPRDSERAHIVAASVR